METKSQDELLEVLDGFIAELNTFYGNAAPELRDTVIQNATLAMRSKIDGMLDAERGGVDNMKWLFVFKDYSYVLYNITTDEVVFETGWAKPKDQGQVH